MCGGGGGVGVCVGVCVCVCVCVCFKDYFIWVLGFSVAALPSYPTEISIQFGRQLWYALHHINYNTLGNSNHMINVRFNEMRWLSYKIPFV